MTGTVLEEGLRGAGGYLLNSVHERFMTRYDARAERATRDIVSRAIATEIRAGRASPAGGVYLRMRHLGPDSVRRQFKGMVERCADCGFDLASGDVEVVPTAHYMMGGVVFAADCTTELQGLFAAGEDTGGVHGANRLGGNGVANSTVFGGIAGDSIAAWLRRQPQRHADPDLRAVTAAVAACETPFARPPGDLETLRERLHACMWDDVGILRTAAGLTRALATLREIDTALDATGIADGDRAFNLTWQDWLNLKSLVAVSTAIAHAALARGDSRGAHYREDHPDSGPLDASTYTVVRLRDGALETTHAPVRFTRCPPP
jgi:fumarate reductase flavoprotein subunit